MKIIEQILSLLGTWFTGRNKQKEEVVTQFTTFIKEQLTFLMEQVEIFRDHYTAQCKTVNALYVEVQHLNRMLASSKALECALTECTMRSKTEKQEP